MTIRDRTIGLTNHVFGWMGTICLLAILPIKLVRVLDHSRESFAVGITPSILGPAGLLFLLLSSTGRLARLTLLRVTLLAAAVSVGLEFLQLLPRPGVLARVRYTFDWFDLGATIGSVVAAWAVSAWILRRPAMPAGKT